MSLKKLPEVIKYPRFNKRKISKLRYAMFHSVFGFADGVSIVMKQIEGVMTKDLAIPKENIFYLTGKSKCKSKQITQNKVLWHKYKPNLLALKYFKASYGGPISEIIEKAIENAKYIIEKFIIKNKIDVLICHNTSHPTNFIGSVAISRFYRDAERLNKKTPKYILWWHDSHFERPRFRSPPADVNRYLTEGVPGTFVEYTLFINSMQFTQGQKYFQELDKIRPGFYESLKLNNDVIYNTTDTFIECYENLVSEKTDDTIKQFLTDFKVMDILHQKGKTLKDVLFCLQHTRIVDRKRIDFALKYNFELFNEVKKQDHFKAFYFFVSGHGHPGDRTKQKLRYLHKKLCKQYNTTNFFLVFADQNRKSTIHFEEYPRIFAKLGGFSTYFSEIEGFGNNLLEVMASGLIPVVHTYPVFLKDIIKFKFKCIALNEFSIDPKDIKKTIEVITSQKRRKLWVNYNLEILRKKFPHQIIARKLQRAVMRRRSHF